MARLRFHLALAAALLAGAWPAGAAQPLLLGGDERLLVLAPHPDDETLAAGGLIQEALGLDVPVRVCFFTMGDNNEIAFLFTRRHPVLMPGVTRSSGMLRQNEALAACTQLGLSTNDVVFLGYPDSGTLDIWNHHWRAVPPYRSSLTRATAVPYPRALTPGSAYAGEDILDDLSEVIRDFAPTHIVVPHPADHNVDHRALYLFARVALWEAQDELPAPGILAAPVHFTQWPEPRQYQPMRPAAPPYFLDEGVEWVEMVLAPFQVSNKLAALRRHHSQFLHSSAYLQSFLRKSELFGDLPDIALPGGAGSAEIGETDESQFRSDKELFQSLSQESGQWNDIAGQNAAETSSLDGRDNDFESCSISGDGTRLTLSFRFRKPVEAPASLSVRLFGYRAGTLFGDMPKIEIELSPDRILAVHDLDARLPEESVERIPGTAGEIAVRVPFRLLGNPEKIFIGAKLSQRTLPIDWVPWRVLDLSGAALPAITAPPPKAEPSATTPAPKTAPAQTLAPPAAKPPPPPPPAVDGRTEPPGPPPALAPRVNLPRQSIPEKTEANEPVLW